MNKHNDSNDGALKIWLEDNLRVLLSILIVVAIAGGIYSYSKRSVQAPANTDTVQESQDSLLDKVISEQKDANMPKTEQNKKEADVSQGKQVASATTETSRETEDAFVESAKPGDGMTQLARRAAANYLEKNPDSELTLEHKVYIEDYLRKNVKRPVHVTSGSSVEFSKTLIDSAIEKSKNLNEKQLQHLKQYSMRAPSLR